MFFSNGPTMNNQRDSSTLMNGPSRMDTDTFNEPDDELINLDIESFSLSSRSRNDSHQASRRNAESAIELPNDLNDGPLNHFFGPSSTNEMNHFAGRQRRGSLFEDNQPEELRSSSSSSRIFSVKASVNRTRDVEPDENETIPFIPDIDELDDSIGPKETKDLPNNFVVNKLISLQELEKDMTKHQTFSSLCGTDSSILSSRLIPQQAVKEEDTPWTWDSLISQVSSYIERKDDE